jgi:Type II secretion system (T2SS), protein J
VRFSDSNGNVVTSWPPTGANPNDLPPAIEVSLAVKGVGSFKRLFLVNR